MKELESLSVEKSLIKKEQIQKQQVLKFSIIKKPGLKLFKCSLNSMEISECVFEKSSLRLLDNGGTVTNHKILFEKNTLYCQALNKKNALKKFKKMTSK